VPRVSGVLSGALNLSPYAGNVVSFLLGSTNQYPEEHQFLLDSLKTEGPQNKTGFLKARSMAVLEGFAYFAGQDVWRYCDQGVGIGTGS